MLQCIFRFVPSCKTDHLDCRFHRQEIKMKDLQHSLIFLLIIVQSVISNDQSEESLVSPDLGKELVTGMHGLERLNDSI